jgi:predicted  nucleic acid-binding Zn-ribbon protein
MTEIPLSIEAVCGCVPATVVDNQTLLAELVGAAKADAVSKSNPKFLLYYERQRTKRWPVVVTLNHDGVCDGCHMKQPPFVEQLVQHNKDLVACTMCGRILYRDL